MAKVSATPVPVRSVEGGCITKVAASPVTIADTVNVTKAAGLFQTVR